MKKLFFFLMAVLAISLSSCSKDNDSIEDEIKGSRLIGSWVHLYDIIDGKKYECTEPEKCILTFTKNTVIDYCKDDVLSGHEVEYTVNGNVLWILGIAAYEFTISGNSVVFDFGDGQTSYYKRK